MFRRSIVPVTAFLIAIPVLADDKKAPPDEKAMMEMMEKHAKPGPFHKKLEPLVGEWTYKASFSMAPGGPAMEMTGAATRKWLLDGRFMSDDIKNDNAQMPFHGMGVTGYDNASKKYTSVWIDSMTTSISVAEGDVDASGKVFTYHSNDFNPMYGQKVKGRNVITIKDNDHHELDFYTTPPGGAEFKSGTIKVTRKK